MSDRPTGAPQPPADAVPAELGPATMSSSVERGLGAVVDHARPGSVRIHVPLVPGRLDPAGQPTVALLSCLGDFVIGMSVCTSFVPPSAASTLELRIDRADLLTTGARRITVEGRVSSVHDTSGLGVATFADDAGTVVARGMATMALRPGPPPGVERPRAPGATPAAAASDARLVEDLDPVALDHHPVWDGADPAVAVVPVDATMANPFGQVHGGVLMAIAERAQRRLHPPGATLLTATIEYLRPAPVADGSVHCTSTVIRLGRRFSTVRTELVRPDGKLAAVSTGIAATPL